MSSRVFVAVMVLALGSLPARAADRIEKAGTVLQIALPVAASVLTIGHRDAAGALQLAISIGVSEAITLGLKHAVNETRPNGGNFSFPSGHTSLSFTSAEFMRRRYGWAFGAPAYAVAAFVGYSRVESRQHYAHDVIAGAGIGFLSSSLFTKKFRGMTVSATGDSKSFRITMTRRW